MVELATPGLHEVIMCVVKQNPAAKVTSVFGVLHVNNMQKVACAGSTHGLSLNPSFQKC